MGKRNGNMAKVVTPDGTREFQVEPSEPFTKPTQPIGQQGGRKRSLSLLLGCAFFVAPTTRASSYLGAPQLALHRRPLTPRPARPKESRALLK